MYLFHMQMKQLKDPSKDQDKIANVLSYEKSPKKFEKRNIDYSEPYGPQTDEGNN